METCKKMVIISLLLKLVPIWLHLMKTELTYTMTLIGDDRANFFTEDQTLEIEDPFNLQMDMRLKNLEMWMLMEIRDLMEQEIL